MNSKIKSIAIGLAFSILIALGFEACKSESDSPQPDNRTPEQFIMLSAWKLTASTCNVEVDIDMQNGASKDLISQMKACELDDIYTFNADSSTTEKANVKCVSNEPASYKGDWVFSADKKTLIWNGDSYSILGLNASNLTVKSVLKLGSSTYEITDTYSH